MIPLVPGGCTSIVHKAASDRALTWGSIIPSRRGVSCWLPHLPGLPWLPRGHRAGASVTASNQERSAVREVSCVSQQRKKVGLETERARKSQALWAESSRQERSESRGKYKERGEYL